MLATRSHGKQAKAKGIYTYNRLDARYYGTHCCGAVLVCVLVILLVRVGGRGFFEVEDRVDCL